MRTIFSLAALALVAGSAAAAQPAIGVEELPFGPSGSYDPLTPALPTAFQPPAFPPAYPPPAFPAPAFPGPAFPPSFPPPVLPPFATPTIKYVHLGRVPECARFLPPIETVLEVKVPCGGTTTTVPIPVCLPACCTDVPLVTCHWGLSGRGVVRYDYCCGVSVKIVVRRTGDFVVHYHHA